MFDIMLVYEFESVDSQYDRDLGLNYICKNYSNDKYIYENVDLENVGIILNDIYLDIKNGACKNLISIKVSKNYD